MENYFNAYNYFSISHWAIKKGKVFIHSLSGKELQLINKLDYSLKLVPAHLMTAFSSVYKLNRVKSLIGMPCWQLVSSDIFLWSLVGRLVAVKSWALHTFYGTSAVPTMCKSSWRSSLPCVLRFMMLRMFWLFCLLRNWNGPLLTTTTAFLNLSDHFILFLQQFAAVDISEGKVWNVFSLMVQFSTCFFFLTHYICIRDSFKCTILLLNFTKNKYKKVRNTHKHSFPAARCMLLSPSIAQVHTHKSLQLWEPVKLTKREKEVKSLIWWILAVLMTCVGSQSSFLGTLELPWGFCGQDLRRSLEIWDAQYL